MSDALQMLVDTDVAEAEAEATGERAIAWLTERQFLGPFVVEQRRSGNPFEGMAKAVRDQKVWPPGPRALQAVEPQKKNVFDFRRRDPNRVELRLGRELYAQEGARCMCPGCHGELRDSWELLSSWRDGGADVVRCPLCAQSSSVKHLQFDPSGAAGALAIVFWNWWPLRPAVVEELSEALGHRLVRVWDFL